jgi:multicomponent K+:H+ antiporter subunit D
MWTGADMANHWLVMPIALPLLVGALLVLLEKAQSRWSAALSLANLLALVWLAVQLLLQAHTGEVQAYLLGNWSAPWGIALALDRLSALMLLLTALVGLASLVYALGGDDRKGHHFHALLQFQLMGLNGAFLTADLFNLFVFFDGLLLHGACAERLKASVHYVVFNLTGSALFLIAVSLLYALAGTLNLADLAVKLPQLGTENAKLAQAAVLLLVVVFAVKAALLPLYFWLPATYAAACAPVAALFAIMTKVGVYAIARVSTLFTGGSDPLAGLLTPLLPTLALATLVLASLGAMAAQRLRGLVAYLVVASAGTLLLAIGLGTPETLAAGLFYVVNSTFIACLWFLLADRIAWARGGDDSLIPRQLQHGWAPLGAVFFVAAVASRWRHAMGAMGGHAGAGQQLVGDGRLGPCRFEPLLEAGEPHRAAHGPTASRAPSGLAGPVGAGGGHGGVCRPLAGLRQGHSATAHGAPALHQRRVGGAAGATGA